MNQHGPTIPQFRARHVAERRALEAAAVKRARLLRENQREEIRALLAPMKDLPSSVGAAALGISPKYFTRLLADNGFTRRRAPPPLKKIPYTRRGVTLPRQPWSPA